MGFARIPFSIRVCDAFRNSGEIHYKKELLSLVANETGDEELLWFPNSKVIANCPGLVNAAGLVEFHFYIKILFALSFCHNDAQSWSFCGGFSIEVHCRSPIF